MNFIKVDFGNVQPEVTEILTAELLSIGFDSFYEENGCFYAFVPENIFNHKALEGLQIFSQGIIVPQIVVTEVEEQNWNLLWESNFSPVVIEDKVNIRAPFHTSVGSVLYEVVIEPKMSFGTGHHETTSMMVRLLLDSDLTGKTVLDMGCGTAVLAILAGKMGAASVFAVDNDDWAYRNSIENVDRNGVVVSVIHGNVTAIKGQTFDLILANINRNVLIADIPEYSKMMKPGALLMLSGFYSEDINKIKERCGQFYIEFRRFISDNNWVACEFIKC